MQLGSGASISAVDTPASLVIHTNTLNMGDNSNYNQAQIFASGVTINDDGLVLLA